MFDCQRRLTRLPCMDETLLVDLTFGARSETQASVLLHAMMQSDCILGLICVTRILLSA